jgi:hypothetical protein
MAKMAVYLLLSIATVTLSAYTNTSNLIEFFPITSLVSPVIKSLESPLASAAATTTTTTTTTTALNHKNATFGGGDCIHRFFDSSPFSPNTDYLLAYTELPKRENLLKVSLP